MMIEIDFSRIVATVEWTNLCMSASALALMLVS